MNQSAALGTPAGEPSREDTDMNKDRNVAQLKLSIAQYLAEIDQIREQMSRDQVEIERSQKRTHVLLAELKALVTSPSQKAA